MAPLVISLLWAVLRKGLFAALGLYVLCLLADTVRKAVYRLRQAQYGCKPAPAVGQSPFLFGVDWVLSMNKTKRAHRFLAEYNSTHERLHRTFAVDLLGVTVIHTCDPVNLKYILTEQFPKFIMGPVRHATLGPLMSDGIFTSDGEAWSYARRTIKPSLTRQLMTAFPLFESGTQSLLSKLPRDGTPVDLQPLVFQLTMDTTTEFLFGYAKVDPQQLIELDSALELTQAGMAPRSLAGRWMMDIVSSKQFFEACRAVHRIMENHVAKALTRLGLSKEEEEEVDRTVLGALARRYTSGPLMADQIISLLVAGKDTTACLISLAVYETCRQPEVLAKLRAEVAALDGQPPTLEQLNHMQYLSWVIKESEYCQREHTHCVVFRG